MNKSFKVPFKLNISYLGKNECDAKVKMAWKGMKERLKSFVRLSSIRSVCNVARAFEKKEAFKKRL